MSLLSRAALLCVLISNSALALTPTPRLCRLMCGRPLAFRLALASDSGLCPVTGAQPRIVASLNGSAQRFRTSDGEAERLSVEVIAKTSASIQADPSVELFWGKFKTAVQKSDKNSVAAMSQFPLEMPYGFPKIRNRTQLIRRWRDLFTVQANAVKCFEEAKPVVDPENKNRFTVGCKNEAGDEVVIYGFTRTRAVWKLAFLDNINE